MTKVAFHTTHQKGYQCKLLVVHSKGGRCNFWGFLDCDDRRLKWWASHNGPQYDRSRSDTVMIKMNFNSYASLAIFFIIAVLFCFVFEYETVCTMREFSCVWFLLSYLSLLSDRAWKPSKSDCPLVFSLRNFRLCLRYNKVNYGAWHVYKHLFIFSVATCLLACYEISLSINEKLERSPEKGQTYYHLEDGVTALAQFYALYFDRARSFNQWHVCYVYSNFIMNKDRYMGRNLLKIHPSPLPNNYEII